MRDAGTLSAGVRFQVCLQQTPMADRLLVRCAAGSVGVLRSLRTRLQGRPREDLRGEARMTTWRFSGMSPGGAGLGGLFPEPVRTATSRTSSACWPGWATPCRKRWSSATGSVLRHAERRACCHARRPRQHGRDDSRHPHAGSTALAVRPCPGAETPGRRSLLRAVPPSACPRAAISFSASSTTTSATATGASHRCRRQDRLRLRHRH